jgi:hypothetical protein
MNGPNGQQYPFHEPVCRGRADWRAEFPVIKDGTFEDDSPAGIYRAIYHFNTVANKNPPGGVLQATYCGFIYHNGETDFKCCDNGDPFLPARLEGPLLQEPLGIAA